MPWPCQTSDVLFSILHAELLADLALHVHFLPHHASLALAWAYWELVFVQVWTQYA